MGIRNCSWLTFGECRDILHLRLIRSHILEPFSEKVWRGMFKLSKKADYGLIAVKHLAMHRQQHSCSANEIAEEYGISATLMAKVLQKLAHHSLVAAKHGLSGGYQLAKEPGQISALDLISVLDGSVLITSCVTIHGICYASEEISV